MKMIDISQPLQAEMNVWPGDTPFTYEPMMKTSDGDSVNVAKMTMSTHTGTHMDAPFHVNGKERKIDELPLDFFNGEAVVIDITDAKTITVDSIQSIPFKGVKKVLFKTTTSHGGHTYEGYPEIDPGIPPFLQQAGVHLIGVDFPSVDRLTSKELPIHHALNKAEILIVEGLDLSKVKQGFYELYCFPLPLADGDGSPVRAVLKDLGEAGEDKK
ncbi:cyclase family protein [Alteribacter aurantiacus]|uniref:cyclase family protein n=1 Tax=Alteribacter aurantiacus TaxID=254410 RepID=UPI0004283783|nr:cyclase family protein [Alteribacter aurantiacus]